jgi:hypothetical protein
LWTSTVAGFGSRAAPLAACGSAGVAPAIAGTLGSVAFDALRQTGRKKPMNLAHVPSSRGGDVGVPAPASHLAAEADRVGAHPAA